VSYYRECPNCGAHLDPGEACDCEKTLATKDRQPHTMKVNRHNTTDLFNKSLPAARAVGNAPDGGESAKEGQSDADRN